jgi:hypothetical protein
VGFKNKSHDHALLFGAIEGVGVHKLKADLRGIQALSRLSCEEAAVELR